jgi:FMN phosphatase YigB (HAD superfamily)
VWIANCAAESRAAHRETFMSKIKVVLFDLGDTLVDSNDNWLTGAQTTLAALAAAGLRLGIVSNTGTLTRQELLAELPATFTFDAFDPALVLLSSEVHIEKPDLAIFRLAVKRAHVAAASILFCTETALHALAAQRAGLKALRLMPPPHSDVGDVPALVAALEDLA